VLEEVLDSGFRLFAAGAALLDRFEVHPAAAAGSTDRPARHNAKAGCRNPGSWKKPIHRMSILLFVFV